MRSIKSWLPLLIAGALCSLHVFADTPGNGNPTLVQQGGTNNLAGNICTQAQAASGSQTTLTISACGSGFYQYITYLEFDLVVSATTTAGTYAWTTTNLSSLQFDQAVPTTAGFNAPPIIISSPIKAPTANTSITFTGASSVTGLVEGVRVCYYCAP